MKSMNAKPKVRPARRSIRLPAYDYASMGAYFVTTCTANRACVLGNVDGPNVALTATGNITADCWRAIPLHFPHISLDAWVVMPNHLYGIVFIGEHQQPGAACRAPTPRAFGPGDHGSLSSAIRSFKSASARAINLLRGTPGSPVWQRNYYEHVIRSEEDLLTIRQYIENNPILWAMDEENPARLQQRTGKEP